MKNILVIILIGLFGLHTFSQTDKVEKELKKQSADTIEGWKAGGTFSINLAQVSFTNWSAGGQNSVSLNGLVNLFANYKKGNSNWENYLDIGYGTIKQGKNADWWKTDDKIDFTSKYGQKAFSNWYYAGLINFKTQMAEGYNYPDDSTLISDLLAPGYLLGAIGLDYKKTDNFTAFIAPVTSKITIVKNQSLADAGAFGVEPAVIDSVTGNQVEPGKTIKVEFGGYIRLFYKKDLMENISLQTKLDLFSNYLENPQNIDVSWEVMIFMKINKYISATISTHLLYDDDTDIWVDDNDNEIIDNNEYRPRTQFKEVIGVGFSYKF